MTVDQQRRYVNWAGNYQYGFTRLATPTTLEDVQQIVADTDSGLTVIGSGHSFNAIADGNTALALTSMPSKIGLNADRSIAHLPSGLSYGHVATWLRERGLALPNLASLPHISVAGAIATATHGSGNSNGNLATSVAALEMVTASGDIRTVHRGDPDFNGYPVHLGALGVVTRVSVDVVPEFEVTQRVYDDLPWNRLIEDFDDVFASGYSVSVFTRFTGTAGQLWVKQRRDRDRAAPILFGAPAAPVQRHPIDGLPPENCTRQMGSPGASLERLPHFRVGFNPSNGDELQSEYHVPRDKGPEAIEILLSMRHRFQDIVQDGEFRTVRSDDLWMSPQYQQDTLAIHFTWDPDESAVREALRHVESALAPLGVRSHWGKVGLDAGRAHGYPRLGDFRRLKHDLDPTGKFTNPWLSCNVFADRP
jgi:xylitol oxidase